MPSEHTNDLHKVGYEKHTDPNYRWYLLRMALSARDMQRFEQKKLGRLYRQLMRATARILGVEAIEAEITLHTTYIECAVAAERKRLTEEDKDELKWAIYRCINNWLSFRDDVIASYDLGLKSVSLILVLLLFVCCLVTGNQIVGYIVGVGIFGGVLVGFAKWWQLRR